MLSIVLIVIGFYIARPEIDRNYGGVSCGFRWSFYENADVPVGLSLTITAGFLALCLVAIWWIFRTGYRLRS